MHIQEGTNTNLTTCTKMTEEVDRRHGVNGTSSKGVNEDAPVPNSAHTGGRLKFFKDGKFILELVRGSAREGERAGWVSVPRKTFWPPAAAPATPPAPPLATLSVSDDNSSVQSSPWQRDHCWKQTAPRKNLSRHLAFYYCRPDTLPIATIDAGSRAKRRRPFDTTDLDLPFDAYRRAFGNGICERKRNGNVDPTDRDVVDGESSGARVVADDDRWTNHDRERYYRMKLKKPYQHRKPRVYKKTRPKMRRRELARVVDRLREKTAALPTLVNVKLANCRQQEHAMVSPRKRILRELERVSLEELGSKRRARTAIPAAGLSAGPPAGPLAGPPAGTLAGQLACLPAASPGPSRPSRRETQSRNVSSYSIHSLLSMGEEELKRSPKRSPKRESPCSSQSPVASPSPEAGQMGQVGQVGQVGRGGAAVRWPGYGRDVYVYGYGYGYAPYRPPPLWMHYAVAPGPWPPLAHPLLTDHVPRDDPPSDLPLNLSKH